MRRDASPTAQRSEKAIYGCLQRWRVVAYLARLSESLVDYRIEGDDATDQLASFRLCLCQLPPGPRQRTGKPVDDLDRQIGQGRCRPPLGAAKISAREDDAGANDPDADLARAPDRQHEDVRARPSGRAE